jgi:hypothetical protein
MESLIAHETKGMNVEIAELGKGVMAGLSKTTRITVSLCLIVFVVLLIRGGNAYSAAGPGDPPVYNPASESYFQLLALTTHKNRWSDARQMAASQIYKGVRGRLASVKDSETHEFILRTFDMSREVWIGLRYWCRYRMLEWDGERPYSPSDPGHFQAWHSQWIANSRTFCPADWTGSEAYMAIYYRNFGGTNARWQGTTPAKFFGRILVEFSTGEE